VNLQSVDVSDPRARLAAFAALGAAQVAVYGALAAWTGYHDRPAAAMLLALLAFVLYLAALHTARPLSGRIAFATAITVGLLFRLLLLPEPPFLSDDHFRYLWDGLVQVRGLNPYRHAPADSALAGLDDALRAQVNHPEVRTIYPPLAQLVFRAVAVAAPGSWMAIKIIWAACDIGIAALLYRLVPARRRLQAWTLYWWSPLVVVEVAWNAHLDLLGVLPIVLALWSARRAPVRSAALGAALAAAALVKYFAVAFLPTAFRAGRSAKVAAAFLLVAAAAHLPYIGAGPLLFDGLTTYAARWRFNDGLFRFLEWITGSGTGARAAAGVIVLALVVQSVRNAWTFERAVFWLTGAILTLSPTVHPWYLLWVVPLVAIRPNPAWLYLTGAVFLAYYGLGAYRATGDWPEPVWVKLAIYGPFFALLARDGWRGSWGQSAWEALRIGARPGPDR
jgi:hypothetical protein